MKKMMKNNITQLTKEAFESLSKELRELNDVKRPALVARLSRAMAEGDLAENADYQNAKEELEFLDGRISELEDVVNNANVMDDKGGANNGAVGIGTKVSVKAGNKKQVFTLVGEWEADPVNQKISHSSPLGQMLMGKRKGDKVTVEAPAGKVIYEILEID